MADFSDVREIGFSLPGVVESTSYGTPSLKLAGRRGEMIARLRRLPLRDAAVARAGGRDHRRGRG